MEKVMDNIIDVKGLKRSFKTPKNGEFEAIKGRRRNFWFTWSKWCG